MDQKTPSPDTLALLAATLVRTMKTPPKQAVEYALELWTEAQQAVTLTAEMKREVSRRGEADAPVTMPRKFPASFNEFLRLIVPGRGPDGRRDRFRDYLQSRYGKKANAEFTWRDKEGFLTADEWKMEAGLFLKWWPRQKSIKAAAAAKKSLTRKR